MVGFGDRLIVICYFEEENDWWVLKYLKKLICSIIIIVVWYFNLVFFVVGFIDVYVCVLFSFIKGVDVRLEFIVWGERLFFNIICGEYLNNLVGWIYFVVFFFSGDVFVFVVYDSSIIVVYLNVFE